MFGRKKLLARIDQQRQEIRRLRRALWRCQDYNSELQKEIGRLSVKTEMQRPDLSPDTEIEAVTIVAVFEGWD